MNLWLVTFDVDLTQFLVEADNVDKAIQFAMMANDTLGEVDDDPGSMYEKANYSTKKVDFNLLKEIIKREDWVFCNKNIPVVIYLD